jgi:hypothetical protein
MHAFSGEGAFSGFRPVMLLGIITTRHDSCFDVMPPDGQTTRPPVVWDWLHHWNFQPKIHCLKNLTFAPNAGKWKAYYHGGKPAVTSSCYNPYDTPDTFIQ